MVQIRTTALDLRKAYKLVRGHRSKQFSFFSHVCKKNSLSVQGEQPSPFPLYPDILQALLPEVLITVSLGSLPG